MARSEQTARLVREFAAALLVLLLGAAFILLAAFGKVYWGEAFDSDVLKYPGIGMLVVSLYVLLGVSLPRLLQGQANVTRATMEREAKDANPE